MKRVSLLLLSLLALPIARAAGPFEGEFVADVQGQAIRLTLRQNGRAVQGLLQAPGGQPTNLNGEAQADAATGLAGNEGGLGAFEARRNGNALTLTLAQLGPDGSPQSVRLDFRLATAAATPPRAAGAPRAAGTPRTAVAPAAPAAAAGKRAGDPRLVGLWRKSDSYTSGSFTAASETFMEVAADGRLAYGAGRVLAGNADVGGDSGRGAVEQAEWRAEGGVLSLRAPGGAWQVIGRYQVSDSGMLIYLPNGSKELWYRQ